LKFSLLNLTSAFGWAQRHHAVREERIVRRFGVRLNAWWGPFVPALFVILFFRWLY
jgi:hypothetical protein